MISDKPNVSLGVVYCSLYTRGIFLRNDYHKKRFLAKTFIISAWQNQFVQRNLFNNAPVRRIAIAMNTNSAFTGSYTENPFWYQQFDLRQIRILRGGQPILDFYGADKCRLYVTKLKVLHFHDDIPSILNDNLKTAMYYCLIWLQCKMLLKFVITQN